MSLLPTAPPPEIVKSRPVGRAGAGKEPDALLVVAPDTPEKELFRQLPESERWQELNARAQPRAGTVRTTVLRNRQQTLAVLGYIGALTSPGESGTGAGRAERVTRCSPCASFSDADVSRPPAFRAPHKTDHSPGA